VSNRKKKSHGGAKAIESGQYLQFNFENSNKIEICIWELN
jgi:hypothetical protein